ncbi:aminotransferase class IV family protein [Luteimonas salinilitoris]|uniref:Aminotransferase class IV family protein n=1 Tax=Luteimonas salinilitoris TaxID=3237697 RepID=A0ABV4HNT6_9GAMM
MTSAWIDGRPAPAEALRALALSNYGHFSTMQVRGGAVQGFDLHLRRLRDATRELFGCELEPERVRTGCRHALQAADAADCTLRTTVFAPGYDIASGAAPAELCVLIAILPPSRPPDAALRVKSFRYRRAAPHIKHVGTFPLFHHRRLAAHGGYDDALFVDGDGRVLEGSVWNIGFHDGSNVVWPDAPALRGVTERLLQAGLADAGVPQVVRPVALRELDGFVAAFAANSRGVQAIAGIDAERYAVEPAFMRMLADALSGRPWQPI